MSFSSSNRYVRELRYNNDYSLIVYFSLPWLQKAIQKYLDIFFQNSLCKSSIQITLT